MTPQLPAPPPTPGAPDFWQKFGETAAMIGLTIGEEAALIFAQAFANKWAAGK